MRHRWMPLFVPLVAGLAAGCGGPAPTVAPAPTTTLAASPSASSSPLASARATPTPVPTWPSATEAAVHPAPTSGPEPAGTIVFSRDGDVYRVGLPDGHPLRLTNDPVDEFDPDLSPDGSRIAYRRASGTGDEADIWMMASDGSDAHDLTGDPSLSNWAPAWSPDGSRLCFNSTRGGSTNRVWTMAADGSDARRVTDGWGEYCDWSPDGATLVYAAPAGSNGYDLWFAGFDGSPPERFTSLADTEFFPAWSPDGRFIAFEQLASGVWLASPDGADVRFLGEGGGVVWAPDGRLGLDRPGGLSMYDPAANTLQRLGQPLAIEVGEFPSWGR